MAVFPSTAAAQAAGRTGRRTRKATGRGPGRTQRSAYLFIAPIALGFLVFYLWPLLQTFYFSFTSFGVFGGNTWVGGENYQRVVQDVTVGRALLNTLVYMAMGLVTLPVAIVLADLMNRPGLRGVSVYRALYFLPFITLPTAVGLVWNWLYNGDFGMVNEALSVIGVDGRYWVSDPSTAVYAIGTVMVWSQVGYYLIIFIAGIKAIPRDYYEAAQLDGAGPVRRFFRITLPLLSPSIFFASVICVINSLQQFDLIYVMMSPVNPALGSTQSIVTLFYKWAFEENSQGGAAALAFLLMLLIAGLTYLQFRFQKRWVHYA
ncbi:MULTISPECIES: carbohydrate ABC transporter permease [Streptomyces]|uniref:Sugar ABC transporter permease n=1 Tax=Streptomyces lycii TaxID=2654337 RepID=A0ABQ7FEM0_9ACTN|nr:MULTISPECIES: sugar ABC transporter permease [Streptomyces]KAF4407456.1 sugar ABC transporter permease [Streptomyces lycii]PGH46743.1 sugar ABC transporter permease [Streptomyces sp. Ru87]